MTLFLFAVAHRVHRFFVHKHRARTKRVLMHSSAALLTVDCLKALGLMVGGELVEHFAHVCGATGAMLGVMACYLEGEGAAGA
jgi:hypothetical protein